MLGSFLPTTLNCSLQKYCSRNLTLFLIVEGNAASYSKPVDAFAFEEDSSDEGLSPDQERSDDTQGNPSSSPQETKIQDASSSPDSVPTQVTLLFDFF